MILSADKSAVASQMQIRLYDYMIQTRRDVDSLVTKLKDINDPFGHAFAQMSNALTLEPGDQRFFVRVGKARSPLPAHIELPPFPAEMPPQDQVKGIVQMLELYYLFARGTLRRYYVFTTPSLDQIKREIEVLGDMLKIPLHELKIFRRSRKEPPEDTLEKERRALPPDVEIRYVRGPHYTHTIYELYVLNSAYSLALAYVLVGVHFGTIWSFGEHRSMTRVK
jgi:hypothetical protein